MSRRADATRAACGEDSRNLDSWAMDPGLLADQLGLLTVVQQLAEVFPFVGLPRVFEARRIRTTERKRG